MDSANKATTPSINSKRSLEEAITAYSGKDGGKDWPSMTSETKISNEQVKDAVSRINEYVQKSERTLNFKLDEESGRTVISVYDSASSELIRQIPSELALELAQKLNDEEPSLLFSAQV
ncbi:MAG: flagellar biosynthesis protein FlaG [Thalassobium sp.]|nr:MAG: flagellar biosynthesis protein FlaG [Thalassobium sp.]